LKNGRHVRITSTISDAEMTDSRNQPVLNCVGVARKRSSSTPT
jgi:hypothetical protein